MFRYLLDDLWRRKLMAWGHWLVNLEYILRSSDIIFRYLLLWPLLKVFPYISRVIEHENNFLPGEILM